jgi:hypothetical protein
MQIRYAVINGILNFATNDGFLYSPWKYKICPFATMGPTGDRMTCGPKCALFEETTVNDPVALGQGYSIVPRPVAVLHCGGTSATYTLTDTKKEQS